MSTEFERIARIRAALDREASDVLVANGDDAAVFALDGKTVVSVDTCIENTHFRTGWLSYADLGWRSQVSALSDLTAMGARSRFVIIALAVPKDFSDKALDELSSGIAQALDEAGAVLIGGNVSAAAALSITTTAIGELHTAPVLRSGAKPGDGLYVTGSLGGSGLGLRALLAGELDNGAANAWRRPPLRTSLAPRIAACASACIDISDGLGQDLTHLASASNVGFEVQASALPLANGLAEDEKGYLSSWVSGEEYELLFTASETPNFAAHCIGRARSERGIQLLEAGTPLAIAEVQGFDHFR